MSVPDIFTEKRHLGELGERLWRRAGVVGLAGIAVSAGLGVVAGDGGRRFFFSYLHAFAFCLSLALGALFFVILQHLTRAGWSVVVRRLAEAVAASLPSLAVLFLPILLLGMAHLYRWAHPGALAQDPLLQAKRGYLNLPFFALRWVIYFAAWTLLARFFFRRSVAQDASGEVEATLAMQRRSAPAMVVFALTVTFAAFDLLMSLDAHWYSTIFGVYFFAGSVVGFFALLILLSFGVQRAGLLRRAITVEHYHDMGKLLFAFVVFWAYIGFSQLLLIWYANLPEETEWFLRRQSGGWGWVGVMLVLGHFVVPFVALLSRAPKRRPRLLALAAAWLLLMHWVDLFWLVVPEASPQRLSFSLLDLTATLGMVGLFLAAAAYSVRRQALVPERDPRLAESLMFENA